LVLYGNIDLRQVDLAFNNSERIAEVLVQEGAKVTHGQVLARLDTSRLEPQAATAEAMVEAQQAVVDRLHRGSRPQEIAEAEATVASAQADRLNAQQQWSRLSALTSVTDGRAISEQDLQGARAALDSAQAHLVLAEKSLDMSRIGPRKEDVVQGEAQLRANQSQLKLLRRQLADSELVAPSDAVVRSRLLEPGEMASPQRPVLNLALIDPKWVRAYVSETDLGRIHTGMRAAISTDSFPGRALNGWVGFIASVAEFTPNLLRHRSCGRVSSTKFAYSCRTLMTTCVWACRPPYCWRWTLVCRPNRSPRVARMMWSTLRKTPALLAIAAVGGCIVGPDYRPLHRARPRFGHRPLRMTSTSKRRPLPGGVRSTMSSSIP